MLPSWKLSICKSYPQKLIQPINDNILFPEKKRGSKKVITEAKDRRNTSGKSYLYGYGLIKLIFVH